MKAQTFWTSHVVNWVIKGFRNRQSIEHCLGTMTSMKALEQMIDRHT